MDDCTRIIPTCCNACGGQTGVLAHVTNGRVTKLEPNSENPIGVSNIYENFLQEKNRGARMCPKGLTSIKQLYDPDRILSPLRKKGENDWQEISWDDALDFAAEQLTRIKQKYGPEKLLWFSEDHSFVHIQQDFCRAYGTPNYMNHSNLCDVARKAGFKLTLGDERPIADLANAKYILLFGWNPLAAVKWAYLPAALMGAIEKGAKLVVVDPVFTATAAKAQEWVPIRPGTDGIMALAMGQVIVREKLYDQEFINNWTIGFDQYCEFIKDKTPEWAEKLTGVPAEKIRSIAIELATIKPSVVDTWSGVAHYSNGTEATRAISMLLGLTGQIDRPGTLLIPERVQPKHRPPLKEWNDIKAQKVDGSGNKYPFAHKSGVYLEAREAMLTGNPYQPKAAVFVFQNYAMSVANTAKTYEALTQLDFKMSIDLYLSETAMMCDLVIPGSHFLERYDLTANWVSFPSVSLRQPVVQPAHGGPTEYEFIMELAKRLEFPGFDISYENYLDTELREGVGITLEELKLLPGAVWNNGPTKYQKYCEKGFDTPSRKFEFYSEISSQKGFNPMPHIVLEDALLKGDRVIDSEYPLYLINWKCIEHTHTRTQNNPWLMEMKGDNPLWMNPLTAERLGLKKDDLVEIESLWGKGRAKLRLTSEIHPEVVGLTYGFGHKGFGRNAKDIGITVNDFYEGKAEPMSGQAVLKEVKVKVNKVR